MLNKYESTIIVAKNISYSIFFTGISYLIPVIYTPYLYLKIGAEQLGKMTIIVTIFTFLSFVTDYSSNIIYVRKIASDRGNTQLYIQEIYSIKLFLFVLIALVTSMTIFIIPKLRNDFDLYFFSLGVVLGRALLPNAYFLATEQIKTLSFSYFFSQALYCISIFLFTNKYSDLRSVIILLSVSNIVTSVFLLLILYKQVGIKKFTFIKLNQTINILKQDFSVFVSQIASSGFIYINVLILGLFVSPTSVANYTVVEKIIITCKQGLGAVGAVIYPRLCNLVFANISEGLLFVKKIFIFIQISTFVLSLFLLIFADNILLFFSISNPESTQILQLLSFLPFILSFNIPSFLALNAIKKEKTASIIINIAITLNILLGFTLSYVWDSVGTALSAIFTELFLSIMFTIFIKKHIHIANSITVHNT